MEAKVSGAFIPQAGTGTFPGTGNFAGKTFTVESFDSSGGAASSHATSVAGYFYGNNTDPLLGPASMAPGVTVISCFSSGGYLNGEYNAGAGKKVHSNAWVDSSAVDSLIINFDLAVDEHGFLAVVGLRNGATSTVPPLFASAYNGLVVGRSDGQHSSGGTPVTVLGGGRTKPEIVAPYGSTSWSVGGLSSMAALLYEVASGDASLLNAYDHAEVMKAILMAGATKDEFPAWSRTVTSPIDATFGAGEVNIYESYRILTAGEQAPHKKKNVALRGWDYGELNSAASTSTYMITIPGGAPADEISVILAWNRSLEGKGRNPVAKLRDLNLQLLDAGGAEVDASRSMIENVEHVHMRNLPAGDYEVRVSQSGDQRGIADYALAWRVETGAGE